MYWPIDWRSSFVLHKLLGQNYDKLQNGLDEKQNPLYNNLFSCVSPFTENQIRLSSQPIWLCLVAHCRDAKSTTQPPCLAWRSHSREDVQANDILLVHPSPHPVMQGHLHSIRLRFVWAAYYKQNTQGLPCMGQSRNEHSGAPFPLESSTPSVPWPTPA